LWQCTSRNGKPTFLTEQPIRTGCRSQYLDEITDKCVNNSSIVDIFKFVGNNLKSEIDQNNYVLGGSVFSILPLLENCTLGDQLRTDKSELFEAGLEVLDLLLNSSVPWKEIEIGKRSNNWNGYIKFIQSELGKKEQRKTTSDSLKFESQNIFSEFVQMISEETLQFPSKCDNCQKSNASLHVSSGFCSFFFLILEIMNKIQGGCSQNFLSQILKIFVNLTWILEPIKHKKGILLLY
jgi:hypothetical protein